MKKLIPILIAIGLVSVSFSTDGKKQKALDNKVLAFIRSKNYIFSTRKSVIPERVYELIKEYEQGDFKMGDNIDKDSGKVSLFIRNGHGEYNKLLNFVLVSDSACLLSYFSGGDETYSVTYFIQYKGRAEITEYGLIINDLGTLERVFKSDPKPVNTWTKTH